MAIVRLKDVVEISAYGGAQRKG